MEETHGFCTVSGTNTDVVFCADRTKSAPSLVNKQVPAELSIHEANSMPEQELHDSLHYKSTTGPTIAIRTHLWSSDISTHLWFSDVTYVGRYLSQCHHQDSPVIVKYDKVMGAGGVP